MNFGDFLRGIENNMPVQERTKQDLLDTIRARATQTDLGALSLSDLAFPDGREGKIGIADYKERGLYNDGITLGEIRLIEPVLDAYEIVQNTRYIILRTPDGLGVSKYITYRPALRFLTEEENRQSLEYIESLDNEEKARYFEEREAESIALKQYQRYEKENADEQGESLVFEQEAIALLDMIRAAEPDNNLSL